jgi:hypothetical protein
MSVPEKRDLVLVVDVETLTEPDAHILEVLARLQLTARRMGASIRLRHACPRLRDLLVWSGLADLLPLWDASGAVDGDRLPEQREQLLVDEEVDPGDPAV